MKNKKYNDIPIIAHDSEKPFINFEEINSIHNNKFIQNSISDSKEFNKFKYKEMPIIIHDSQNPSMTFEESNSGIPLIIHHRL